MLPLFKKAVFDEDEEDKYKERNSGNSLKREESGGGGKSTLEELIREEEKKKEKINRKDYWLREGIIVKVMSKALAEKGYYKQKGVVHYSRQGQMFKSQVQSMHKEILQSPWLCELMALHINLRETKVQSRKAHAFFDGCSLTFKDGKPALTCELLDSIKIDIDLTCSICLLKYLYSCQKYWEKRAQSERVERLKQIKEHWESQCRLFVGV
ncbi:E3 ubiquitin-protein ligase NLA-like [Arachis hypogaea]|uniref:E3 ubiquitin-protein ligase NLA-like n=1 Tax=Arachis hypogaea TaxID=3818 RepID=UPI003B221C24